MGDLLSVGTRIQHIGTDISEGMGGTIVEVDPTHRFLHGELAPYKVAWDNTHLGWTNDNWIQPVMTDEDVADAVESIRATARRRGGEAHE